MLSPANEVPAVTDFTASGAATVWLHVVRDSSGQVTSGSVDFRVSYSFPGAVSLTGLHIHRGAAGGTGSVTINSGIGGAAGPIDDATGKGTIVRQAQVAPGAAAALDTIRGMLTDPSGFYVNMHTSVYPDGVMRGQLQRAEMTVLMGLMSTLNESPPITDFAASSITSVVVLSTFNASGGLTSAQVIFDANYTFPAQVTFTGFHIHAGVAGFNGSVVINTGIGSGANSVLSDPSGVGNLHYEVEVPMTNAAAVNLISRLPYHPGDYYVNLHTTTYLGGVIRAQLRNTDNMVFPVTMLPSNEAPPVAGLNARVDGTVSVRTLRNADGSVAAGTVIFDANYRFPADTTFTGFHIHDGLAGNLGSVTINTGVKSEASATGAGNLYRVVSGDHRGRVCHAEFADQGPGEALREPPHQREYRRRGARATRRRERTDAGGGSHHQRGQRSGTEDGCSRRPDDHFRLVLLQSGHGHFRLGRRQSSDVAQRSQGHLRGRSGRALDRRVADPCGGSGSG